MKFITSGFDEIIAEKLKNAVEVKVVSAYFSPDDKIIKLINKIKDVKIIFSNEYQVTDISKLKKIDIYKMRCVYQDDKNGKLHSKVYYIKDKNNEIWCLIGSLNITHSGLNNNQEACVEFNSRSKTENVEIKKILNWFNGLWKNSFHPDFKSTEIIFKNYSKIKTKFFSFNSNCWTVNIDGSGGRKNDWEYFLKNSAIAINEHLPKFDLKTATIEEIQKEYRSDSKTIINLRDNMKINDGVIVCRKYYHNQVKDVHINGIAQIAGPFELIENSGKSDWTMKRKVLYYPLNMNIPVIIIQNLFGKKSLNNKIHNLSKRSFDKFLKFLEKTRNIKILPATRKD